MLWLRHRSCCLISLSSAWALVCHQGTCNIFWSLGCTLSLCRSLPCGNLNPWEGGCLSAGQRQPGTGGTFPNNPFSWIIPSLLFPSPLAHIFISFLVHTSKMSFLSCFLNGACKLVLLFPDVLPCTKVQCLPLPLLPNHQLLVRITSIWAVKSILLAVGPYN